MPATTAAQAATLPQSTAGESDIREAVGAMERGDCGVASERLGRFAAEHPTDPRGEDTAFLAILSLQRAGRTADAASASRAYLSRYPAGLRRAEAAAIAAGE